MAKRTTSDDNPIGLTGAFAPIRVPESQVTYDETDDPMGLTQAFEPVQADDEPSPWDTDDKWAGFDWDAPLPEETASEEGAAEDDTEAFAGDEGAEGAEEAESEPAAAGSSLQDVVAAGGKAGGTGKHARHAARAPEPSERMKKAHKTRRKLVVAIIILLVVVAAAVFFAYRYMFNDNVLPGTEGTEEPAVQEPAEEMAEAGALDAAETVTRTADVPDLSALFGQTQAQAVEYLQRGAAVTATRETGESEEEVIKQTVTIALTEEPGGSRGGLPTVYLGLDKDGKIVQVGYSASATALGFATVDFRGAVETEHVVESTLRAIGADVPDGTAKITDQTLQTTYAKDGTTVQKERCSFAGDVEVAGKPCAWSAVLSYDYTSANISGNVSETVRLIYVYLTLK